MWVWPASSIGAKLSDGCLVTEAEEQGSYGIWKFNVIEPWETNAISPVRTGLSSGLDVSPTWLGTFSSGHYLDSTSLCFHSWLVFWLMYTFFRCDHTFFIFLSRPWNHFGSFSWQLWSIMWDLYFNLLRLTYLQVLRVGDAGYLLSHIRCLYSLECSSPWPSKMGRTSNRTASTPTCQACAR